MLKKLSVVVSVAVFLLAITAEGDQNRKKRSLTSELEKVNNAIEVIEEMVEIPEEGISEQIGIQSADIILVFKRKKSIESITEGKITLGADATVAAGPVGRRAEVSTDIELEAEIYSYSKSRGLFAGVSVEGSAIQIDEDANANFYNPDYLSTHDILFGGKRFSVPVVAKKLKEILPKYTSTRL